MLILEKENLVRLHNADPIDLNTKDYFVPSNLGDVEFVIAYEGDSEKLMSLAKDGAGEVLKYIQRGRTVYDGERVGAPRKL